MSDDDWVKLAMNDDVTVADFLSRLKQAGYQRRLPPPPSRQEAEPPLKLHWSVRQRRSKPLKKKADSTRDSPTTPLSWSGATTTSVSGGGAAIDGFEEYSKPVKPTGGTRSKVSVRREGTTSKRPRKKKTLAELKEEETSLLREKKKLRSEIATLRLNIEKERATKESLIRLKRVKTANNDQNKQVDAVCKHHSTSPTAVDRNGLDAPQHLHVSSPPRKVEELESEKETGFCLPDLNMPAEGDFSSSEVLYGIS